MTAAPDRTASRQPLPGPDRHRRLRAAAVPLTVVLIFIGGGALGGYQTLSLHQAAVYCLGPEPLDLGVGGNAGFTVALLGRAALYAAGLTLLAVPLLVLAVRRNTGRRLAATLAVVALAGGALFLVDHALSDKVASLADLLQRQEELARNCPGGRPPWWPRWLP
jgi:hypothetical protein